MSIAHTLSFFPNTVKYDKQHFNQLQATAKQKYKQDLEQVSIQRKCMSMYRSSNALHPFDTLRFVMYTRAGIIIGI